MTRTPLSRSRVKGQLVADVLNGQHAGTGATWRIKYEDIVNLQGAEAHRRPPAYRLFIFKISHKIVNGSGSYFQLGSTDFENV